MAQARSAEQVNPRPALTYLAAVLVAVVVAALVALTPLNPFRPANPGEGVRFSPAVIASATSWELQRKQQSGEIDYVARSARAWELQRRQQSAFE